MYTTPILVRGDQIASLTGSPSNQGNPGDANFGMILPGVEALADAETTYRLVWFQNMNSVDEAFKNGQGWRLELYDGSGDPATDAGGWTVVPGYANLSPKPDLVAGAGGGDEYVVFQSGNRFLLYDTNGDLPTTAERLVYLGADQNGDPDAGNNNSDLDFADGYAAYCFCAGTLIATRRGPVAIEALAVGDLVQTLDSGLQPIRWIGRRRVTLAEIVAHPNLRPVRVAAGALGRDTPWRDLSLSPQHRVLVRSRIVERMTGAREGLVAATHLCGLPGIAQMQGFGPVDYVHLRMDRHEVVQAEGAWAETLLVGREALKAMAPEARRELRLLFPDLGTESLEDAARPVLQGRSARSLAARHHRNGKALVD